MILSIETDRLELITDLVNTLNQLSKQSTSSSSTSFSVSFARFENYIAQLIDDFPNEYETYDLDEAVVAAVSPLVWFTTG